MRRQQDQLNRNAEIVTKLATILIVRIQLPLFHQQNAIHFTRQAQVMGHHYEAGIQFSL